MQKIENLLVINIKVSIFSKILFFSHILWVPDRLDMDCAVYCHHIVSVSTDHAVAVLRDWFVGVANRHLALGPPSGWRLKKLPGSSQGFCLFLSFSYLDMPFLPLLAEFLLYLCAVLRSLGPQSLWFKLLEAVRTHTILESSASSIAC